MLRCPTILTSVWLLHTPNAGQNLNFQHFFAKKAEKMQKKVVNLQQNLAKKRFFKFAPIGWPSVLFPDKGGFLFFSGNKTFWTIVLV